MFLLDYFIIYSSLPPTTEASSTSTDSAVPTGLPESSSSSSLPPSTQTMTTNEGRTRSSTSRVGIFGGAVGGSLSLILVVIAVFLWWRVRRRKARLIPTAADGHPFFRLRRVLHLLRSLDLSYCLSTAPRWADPARRSNVSCRSPNDQIIHQNRRDHPLPPLLQRRRRARAIYCDGMLCDCHGMRRPNVNGTHSRCCVEWLRAAPSSSATDHFHLASPGRLSTGLKSRTRG
ncbi:hypothetical protein L227DRAFT_28180 [Lentinus tigrinus ALCF2SS1-6]|uniref:Uncharacterized protein n=1 Tax=Lentinus tigrinus ALCF2SS1-6 TaxID=1328759 RepID=A0A5C2SVY1_9APHY|nr:hypothetical protein L227DRAFT_28180 [Lentinus tigrinus ALCF2SS1-6]